MNLDFFMRKNFLTTTAVQSCPELASGCNNELSLGWDDDAEAGKRGDKAAIKCPTQVIFIEGFKCAEH